MKLMGIDFFVSTHCGLCFHMILLLPFFRSTTKINKHLKPFKKNRNTVVHKTQKIASAYHTLRVVEAFVFGPNDTRFYQ